MRYLGRFESSPYPYELTSHPAGTGEGLCFVKKGIVGALATTYLTLIPLGGPLAKIEYLKERERWFGH